MTKWIRPNARTNLASAGLFAGSARLSTGAHSSAASGRIESSPLRRVPPLQGGKRLQTIGYSIQPLQMRNLSYLAKAYVAIRASGTFDGRHYIKQLKRVGFRRFLPLIHYLWSGERKGRE